MNQLTFSFSPASIIAAIVVGSYFTWMAYQHLQRNTTSPGRVFLELLRLIIVFCIILTLFKPEWIERINEDRKPVIAILADQSNSMGTTDIQSGESLVTRQDWLRSALQSNVWDNLKTDNELLFVDFSQEPDTGSLEIEGTDLSSPLESALKANSQLRSVMVLSDGDWNIGATPELVAKKYRSRGVPIFTTVVGRDTPLPDVGIEDIKVPGFGLLGEQVAIGFRIKSTLPNDVELEVELESDEDENQKMTLTLPAFGEIQDSFLFYPETEGKRNMAIKIPVQGNEITDLNNLQEFSFSVRKETLKVLVVDSLPRWEYRYLRNALERDPGVEMNCILFHPGMGMGGGKNYLSQFPNTREALSPYDVIFLGDVGIGDGELTEEQAELIKGLVEQQSSGLVLVPGRRGRILSFLNSPLEELLPVQLDESKQNGFPLQNENPINLTTRGGGHLLTRFEMDEDQNSQLWEGLPGFFWSAPVLKSRPGTEVLGVHGSLRNQWGRLPMLVTKTAGSGHVLFMGTDSAWRWRRGVEDKYHYRLWSQVVRWMAHRRNLAEKEGIRLSFSPENPEAGDKVYLQASILNRAGFPLEANKINARLEFPDGTVELIEMKKIEGGWGVFEGWFQSSLSGNHSISINIPNQGRELKTELQVRSPSLEKIGQPAKRNVLAGLSQISGGQVGGFNELEKLVLAMKSVPEPEEELRRTRLWAHPYWGGLLLLLLSVYWIGRKLNGFI